jgi:uncharacterized protein
VARITVTVSPGAARSELVGRHGDGWKARVSAPLEGGKANEALEGMLADALTVRRSQVTVAAGRSSRRKIIEIDGLNHGQIARRLDARL